VFVIGGLFQGCSKTADPTPTPDNELTDAGGLRITVVYDKTPSTADLDLYIYRKSTYAATSNPQGGTIGPSDTGIISTDIQPVAPDEDYIVVTAYRTGIVAKTYTITFTGITDKKSYSVSGSFAANLALFTTYNYFGTPRGNSVTLKKVKNTYTITQ
jgi:hypothetical protein